MRRDLFGRLAAGIRDRWLILGISLALFLALEWAYRGQAELRRAARGAEGREPDADGVGPRGACIPTRGSSADELRARGLEGVEVTNHAQTGYTLAQDVATLSLMVREGGAPQVAVFLDGNNELAVAWRTGEGLIIVAPFLAERVEHEHDIVSDLVRWGGSSELIQRLGRATGLRSVEPPRPPRHETVCPEVAAQYARQVRQVVAMGEGLGFRPVFLWQPLLATTAKPLSAWEAGVGSREGWEEGLRACRSATVEAVRTLPGAPFHDLSDLFDGHDETVFIDAYGHVTEAANAVIARRIGDLVEDEVRELLGG